MTSADYYATLGVPRSASADDIRRAYREQARKLHPDVNKAPDAAQRFATLQEAYDVLSDPAKRARYDTGGRSAVSSSPFDEQPTPRGSPRGNTIDDDFMDSLVDAIFGGMPHPGPRDPRRPSSPDDPPFDPFARARRNASKSRARHGPDHPRAEPIRPEPLRADITIDFASMIAGCQRSIRVGRAEQSRTIEITIPPAVDDGQQLRVPAAAFGTDLIVTVRVEPPPPGTLFRRGPGHDSTKGLDLFIDVPVSYAEAALGSTITLPTPTTPIELTLRPGTPSGSKLRVKGQGIRTPHAVGDLYAVIKITPPTHASITPALAVALRQLDAASHPPRPSPPWPKN